MAYFDEILADSPIGYWRLGETSGTSAADSSGYGRSGAYLNTPTLGAPSLLGADTNKALGLATNSNQTMSVTSATWMNVAHLSVEALVSFTSATDGQNGDAIVSRYNSPNFNWLLWRNTSGQIAFQIRNTSGTVYNINMPSVASLGTTYHVVGTFDGANCRLFVNGTQVASTAVTGTVQTAGGNIDVGRYSSSNVTTPGATIDEVSVYDFALPSGRITAHYNASYHAVGSLSGKALWLRAKDLGPNGTSVSTWQDQSGQAHHGTSVSTAPTVATNSTPLGGKSVRFAGNGYFNLGSVVTSSSGGEIWLVVRSDGGTGPSSWEFGTDSAQSHYPYGGAVYDDAITNTRQSFTPTLAVTSWRIYRVTNNGTAWNAYLDGTLQTSVANRPVVWPTTFLLGASSGGSAFQGNIAEVIIRTQVSTTQEATDIQKYLTEEHITKAAYDTEVLADSPLGYWRLNETTGATTVSDSSGNNRHMTVTGTPTFAQTSLLPNGTGTAAAFSGGSLASIPAAAWMIVPNFSVEAWFKTTNTSSQTIASMDDSGGAPGESRRRWSVVTSGGTVGFHVFAGGNVFYLQVGANLADGESHHVVAVCENSRMRLYIDGVHAGSRTYSGTLTGGVTTQNPLTIGSGYNQCPTTYWQFNGTIDEVAYYGSALSGSRITAHYVSGGGAPSTPSNSTTYAQAVMADNPTGYWHLDEPAGSTLFLDSSVNANHASPIGPPTMGSTGSGVGSGTFASFANNQYATVTDTPPISMTGAFTLEAWVKPATSASERYILEKYDVNSRKGYAIRLEGMVPRAHILHDTGFTTLDATTPLTANVWSHVVVTYDLTTLRIYINGVESGNLATAIAPTDGPDTLKFAARGNDALAPGTVALDELAVYGTALSPSRVTTHYTLGGGTVSLLSNKLLWLRAKDLGADGSSVDTWPDQSGSANDALRMQNAPTVATGSTPIGGKSVRFNGSSGLYFAKFQGLKISAATSSTYFTGAPGYPPANAIDGFPEMGGYTSVWASTTIPAWLRLQPTAAAVVTSYGTTVRIGPSVNQAPRDWTFEGSNDGTSWTVLDTRVGEIPSAGESRVYNFSNGTAYTYYRINISAVNGSTLASLADLTLNPVAGYGTVDNPLTTGVTAAEIWAVVKADTGGSRGLWSWGGETTGGIDSGYPHSDNRIYESFGLTAGNRQNFLPTLSPNDWQIYRVRNDGTTWEAWMSGTTQATAASKPFGYNSMQLIGRTKISSELSNFFAGNIAEIYMRSQVSTTEESGQIYDYLVREHFSATTTRSVYGAYADIIASSTATPRVVHGAYAEALATAPAAQPPRLLYGDYIEILTPSAIENRFKGWGVPL